MTPKPVQVRAIDMALRGRADDLESVHPDHQMRRQGDSKEGCGAAGTRPKALTAPIRSTPVSAATCPTDKLTAKAPFSFDRERPFSFRQGEKKMGVQSLCAETAHHSTRQLLPQYPVPTGD